MNSHSSIFLQFVKQNPIIGLHLIFSGILLVPAAIGFQNFETIIISVAETLGIQLPILYGLFSAPTVIEEAKGIPACISDPRCSISPTVIFYSIPGIYWLTLAFTNINYIEVVSGLAGSSPSILYILVAIIPLIEIWHGLRKM